MQAPDERVRTKVKCIHALPERLERRCDVLRSPDFGCGDLKAELAGRCLGLAHFHYRGGIADIGHDRQPAKIGDGLAQKFDFLAGSIRCLVRETSDVAARSHQTHDQAGPDRVRRCREHDRNDRCRLLCGEGWRGSRRDNDIDLEPDELGRVFCVALIAALCPAILNGQVTTVDPTEFAEPQNKSGAAAPPNRVMNSRRFTRSPRRQWQAHPVEW